MKILHRSIIIGSIVCLLSNLLPIEAQCYGCGQNSSALDRALVGKQNSQVVTTWWDRNSTYIFYGIMAVTVAAAFLILRRKDESSSDFEHKQDN